MEAMGLRTGLRQGTEICALGIHQQSFHAFMQARGDGSTLTSALQERDEKFGDYRTNKE